MTNEQFKNLPLGSTFQLGNVKLKVVEDTGDDVYVGCFIANTDLEYSELKQLGIIPECNSGCRKDKVEVIFIKETNK